MVAEGDEMAAFRLCSCSSTSVSLEQGLEGMLTDLRWHAILGIGESCDTLKLLGVGMKKNKRQAAEWCLLGFGFLVYIAKEVDATAELN